MVMHKLWEPEYKSEDDNNCIFIFIFIIFIFIIFIIALAAVTCSI